MPEISLYRKYRPQNFSSLVGQDHIRDTLRSALKTQAVSHAYLFTGPRGTGKTSAARLLAKALNCLNLSGEGEPCEQCDICLEIKNNRLIDILEIDAASNRGIDEIRDLKEKINFAPTRAKKKVYIIDEVHMLTKEAFNALLKTLEEPPSHAHFILATTEIHKVPETIISRCQRFDFRRIDETVMNERLQFIIKEENIVADNGSLQLIAAKAEGGLRDAIGLLEQMVKNKKIDFQDVKNTLGTAASQTVADFYQLLKTKNTVAALQLLSQLYNDGVDLSQFSKDFMEYLRQKLFIKIAKKSEAVERVMKMIEIFWQAQQELKNAIIPQLPLELAVIQSTYEASEQTVKPNEPGLQPIPREPMVAAPISSKPTPTLPMASTTEPASPTKTSPALNLEQIKENLPRIYERVKKPSVRMSFKQGHIVAVEGDVIQIQFRSQSHLDKIKQTANRADIEQAFFEVFSVKVKIVEELAKVALSPEVSEKKEPIVEPEAPKEDLVKSALDIFGGEMVKE